jgi:hypothetical protein
MAEFEEKLNALLSDPGAMGQIMSIAKALTGEEGTSARGDSPPPSTPQPEQAPPQQPAPLGEALPLLGELDPKLIQTALRLFGEYNASDNRKTALLAALRPFLKEERLAKMEKAVQIAKLSRVVRVAFQMLKNNGEDSSS